MAITSSDIRILDWNFIDPSYRESIHGIHPYPAKFIPEIPHQLIKLFPPEEGSIILDPFCGSGTSLVEAISMGFDAFGIDLNPLACLISRVKTRPFFADLGKIGKEITSSAMDKFSDGNVEVPVIPQLDHWFEPEIQKALSSLTREINHIESLAIKEALQLSLSRIIVRVSNQESDTRYAAINKKISAQDVFNQFRQASLIVGRSLSLYNSKLFEKRGEAIVLNQDTLTVTSDEIKKRAGLVVTSPPYPNAYEYWLYHKYRMYWLGMDPIGVREKEIGARPHYFKKNHQDETDFERQMGVCFGLLSDVMLPSAKACFLVGRSIIHGRVIDNTEILRRAAESKGFVLENMVERSIPSNRKTFNPSNCKISREHLMIFSRDGK